MKILLHKNFEKQYKKLRPGEKKRFKKQRDLFLQNPHHPLLNNHTLQGLYKGYRSINVGGNLRLIYKVIDPTIAYFVALGTNSELYS
ncbi:MAG: hypothetical protein A3J55_03550 [Candidatus Ryanbacteria bacterium RIFCSPHIGHO2_02_FULL_45_17b]|uniref:Plasmid stabilization protein n=1 Tax=Candidatus Ryanbacteria bacterium RIFCSPHIGHO2_01_FULL_45_22 TaxID=1802114 RepID=A0A1G2G1X5_9BACT|nr:MAG: hypothetical protein A2719_04750 [Candidatus Ryanbacteria bacterium RIFCSPHIGHO2_01_FULL_45_22]OGZ47535.1 MAG: hypothetical protein A3J55_03550 [Candidatus Ryanbacteria bacterium RIFCSPHIGHO2_02_FULL_45_17b]